MYLKLVDQPPHPEWLLPQLNRARPASDRKARKDPVSHNCRCKRSTKMAILVCSKLALQICKLAARLTRQECKLETSLKPACRSDEVTTRRTCNKHATSNSLQT
ncbi:hypothetical protein AVEN_222243-1 [Araneus ventricosus]|uniref:Uncharacterized protein n=1 Tax=Araneus ventricosus TaxID=182803 RepID=A0A4Y2JW80_ARAVE|nr:hypothetical protein AVEN_222243-1 [Araneus ventricosus]